MDWNESELENDDLKTNQPLTSADVKVLEGILWSEVGTKQDYESVYGSIVEMFTDLKVWLGIKIIIDSTNANALAA